MKDLLTFRCSIDTQRSKLKKKYPEKPWSTLSNSSEFIFFYLQKSDKMNNAKVNSKEYMKRASKIIKYSYSFF